MGSAIQARQKTNSFCCLILNTVRNNLHDKTLSCLCGCIRRVVKFRFKVVTFNFEMTDCPTVVRREKRLIS